MDYTYYNYYDSSSYLDATTSSGLELLSTYFLIILPISLILSILGIIAMWKLFSKAGEKGWKSIIPIYNLVILFKISGISPWLILLFLVGIVPVVGWFVMLGLNIYQVYYLSKSFGKGTGFTIGLIFLAPIFYLILGLGSSKYIGPKGNPDANEAK